AVGSRPGAAQRAVRLGVGLVRTATKQDLLKQFYAAGGTGKPRYGQVTVCWARDEATARRTAYEIWPTAAIEGGLSQDLPTPAHFEQAAQMVGEEQVAKTIICSPDPKRHIEGIKKFVDAGYDHVYVHQVGHDQEGFFQFYEQQILPEFQERRAKERGKNQIGRLRVDLYSGLQESRAKE